MVSSRVRFVEPLVPVTVNDCEPSGVEADVATVRVLDPVPGPTATLAGAKVAVVPAGSLVAVRVTWPLNPLTGATEMAKVADWPRWTPLLIGCAVTVKSLAGAAVSPTSTPGSRPTRKTPRSATSITRAAARVMMRVLIEVPLRSAGYPAREWSDGEVSSR